MHVFANLQKQLLNGRAIIQIELEEKQNRMSEKETSISITQVQGGLDCGERGVIFAQVKQSEFRLEAAEAVFSYLRAAWGLLCLEKRSNFDSARKPRMFACPSRGRVQVQLQDSEGASSRAKVVFSGQFSRAVSVRCGDRLSSNQI